MFAVGGIDIGNARRRAAGPRSLAPRIEHRCRRLVGELVANTGYRRYLKTISEDHFATIRQGRGGKGFDGIFVLRTNTDLNPLEVSVNAETGV
jgi:hypothetical protein